MRALAALTLMLAGGIPPSTAGEAYEGVGNAQRAWQNWALNCQGCHQPDASGTPTGAPALNGAVARFLGVEGGRAYLGRVPGVATAPLSNADLAELVNWMLYRFDRDHLPATFAPYTASEIGRLRNVPLRTEAGRTRARLIEAIHSKDKQQTATK